MRKQHFCLAAVFLGLTLLAPALTGRQEENRPPSPKAPAFAQQQPRVAPADLKALLVPRENGMRVVAGRYRADREQLSAFYSCPSPARFARLKRFGLDWASALAGLNLRTLNAAGRKELKALEGKVQADMKQVDEDAAAAAQLEPLVPFAAGIDRLEEARMEMETVDPEKSAVVLSQAIDLIGRTQSELAAAIRDPDKLSSLVAGRDLAMRASDRVRTLRETLRRWFGFYDGYDPLFTWWMAQPYHQAEKALEDYEAFLRDKVAPGVQRDKAPAPAAAAVEAAAAPSWPEVPDLGQLLVFPQDEMRDVVQRFRGVRGRGFGGMGGPGGANPASDVKYFSGWLAALKKLDFGKLSRDGQIDYLYLRNTLEVGLRRASNPPPPAPLKTDSSGIAGRPIGREALMLDLAGELVPYTPEELIGWANRQFAWCEAEMKKASAEMGFGDDWKAAVEKVKQMHAPPGGQPDAVRDLMFGAVDYLRAHDLITVPEIEAETLRRVMMTARQQLFSPFFLGGPEIMIASPTETMTTEEKLESMRGNNVPFSHATAFHEMIPGHNMQFYMGQRFGAFESELGTSFWTEGWAVYWETLLYDMGFDGTPEQRVGALFWRMHRCARIVFSLEFHLGAWSPQECIDYLVDKVGHERDNATAEVRRSFSGGYGPLYQAGYLIGAMQLRELKKEFVDSGRMTLKEFHDYVIRRGGMPIALLRLALGDEKLRHDMPLAWKCFGPEPAKGE